jgi:hypothetical protein
MSKEQEVAVIHPEGERELVVVGGPNQGSTVDTYGGSIHVKWDETAAVTPFGQLAFFHRVSENGRPVGRVGSGMPCDL